MDFAILGALEVRHEGRQLDVGRPKQQALLALLLLHPNEVVSVDRLAEDLWEGSPPTNATGSLQAHISRLRAALALDEGDQPSIISSRRPGYRIDIAEDALDALRLHSLASEGRAALREGRAGAAADLLAAGLALWRGPPLAELSLGPLARADVARLEDLRLGALEDLQEARLELGQHREVLEQLDTLVAEHPLRERFWAQRMVALSRSGRQAEALRAYQDVRRTLAERLGIDPSPELQQLEQAILQQRPELGWERGPGPSTATATVPPPGQGLGNLPHPLTRFIGRSIERAEITALLGERRLVTLTGFGGAGKTRLALQMAAEMKSSYPGGSWLVDLSASVDDAGVGRTVAAAFGIHEGPDRPVVDALVEALVSKDLLLVLDNCEHLVGPCSALASRLLEQCPGLRILATSREALGVPGELCRPVPGLSLPPHSVSPETVSLEATAESEAVQLFVDRASLVRPDFRLTTANSAAVASICHRLDGIPLALELAAARLAALSAEQVEERLTDRFRLLADEGVARATRQRTLMATIEWSDALLSPPERILLWRVSVFSGGFTLDAAEDVCAGGAVDRQELLGHLARLVAKSLVVADTTGHEARYRVLETIRQYGHERLAESGAATTVRSRHARWCMAMAERAEPALTGPGQRAWLDRLETERDNLRAGLAWAVGRGEGELALRLSGALALFWRIRGPLSEGREWLEASLALPADAPRPVLAKALWAAGFMAAMLMDHAAAIPALDRSVALSRDLGDLQGTARSLLILANCRQFTDGPLVTLLLLEEAATLSREADDPWCLGHALSLAGSLHFEQGNAAEARAALGEGLDVARRAGDEQGIRIALWALGRLRMSEGELGHAEAVLAEGLEVSRRLHEPYATAALMACLAEVLGARGDGRGAMELVDEALSLARPTGPGAVIEVLCCMGELAQAEGDLARGRDCFEEALAVAGAAGAMSGRALRGLGEVAQCLGEGREAARLLNESLSLGLEIGNRREVARTLQVLGRLARDEGRGDEAWSLHHESLMLYRQVDDALGTARALREIGGLAARRSLAYEGATLLAASEGMRAASGYVLAPHERQANEADLAVVRDSLTPEELAAAWAEGEALPPGAAAELAAGLAKGPPPPAAAS